MGVFVLFINYFLLEHTPGKILFSIEIYLCVMKTCLFLRVLDVNEVEKMCGRCVIEITSSIKYLVHVH